ncbi:F-box/LRR-repeat protein 4-like [Dysidea avara]|uniref:F-box/LRR-repeat protein 4-like n=1 Tax=Dysidea avara TaxID=196820 RepID=UPI003326D09E
MSGGIIKQYAQNVVNYSSEYGRSGSSSYTASNLAGNPSLSGRYGDFTEAFVLRTYGPWWKITPSAVRALKKRPDHFKSQDFVELQYSKPVTPTGINIYENYHPGAVVRILACNSVSEDVASGEVRWETLWSGPPQQAEAEHKYRVFKPPLKEIDYPTNLIRLEFNSEGCGYYTELDAVELIGRAPSILTKIKNRGEGFLSTLTTKLLRQLSLTDRQTSIEEDSEEFDKWSYFSWLPDEVMQGIFQYLDIISLARASQTCSLFLKHCYDPLLFTELDLQPFWTTVDDVALQGLQSRCTQLQHLDLSWTGAGGLITEKELCNFLKQCGESLITLRLACCQYIGKLTLETIVKECPGLENLDLQSCSQLDSVDLMLIGKLSHLKRLNLYRMPFNEKFLDSLGKGCTQLEHLNLGSCTLQGNVGALNNLLSNLKNLVSLDLWRWKEVTNRTMKVLAENCPNLQELDIGWCPQLVGKGLHSSVDIFMKWPNLKKIFLTCGRAIDDDDVAAIGGFCPQLEQFDILGSNRVTANSIKIMLKCCPKLQLVDVSFCTHITNNDVDAWRKEYPKLCVKKSFQ